MLNHNVKLRKANNGLNLNLTFELIKNLILLNPQHKVLLKKSNNPIFASNANGIRYSIISLFGWFVDYYPSVFVKAFLADNNTECFTVTLKKYNTSNDVARTQYCQRSKWAVRKLLELHVPHTALNN